MVPIATTAKYYGLFFSSLCSKLVNVGSDTWKVALFTSAYTPNQDTHQYFDVNCTAGEVANGSGYVTGGATISPLTVAYDGPSNVLSVSGAAVSWTSATFTARYAVIYDSTPASNKPLLGYLDFGADQSPSSGTLSIAWNPSGIATVTVA